MNRPRRSTHWDIFCRVVDNFGDAGVCWRLARQLANEHGCTVRLWIDQPDVLATLASPAAQAASGVQIGAFEQADAAGAGVVIEAFACGLPEAYEHSLPPDAAWIVLDYLSAEDWVEGFHRQPSPHPHLPLQRHFFYPGFTARTGGLLREASLTTTRQAFQHDPVAQTGFWQGLGLTPDEAALKISLFAYENAALPALLDAWAANEQPVFCAVPTGRVLPAIAGWAGEALVAGSRYRRGALEIAVLPFLPQDDYDRLLWACDLNFVRGEDSFVRAQWAARPFVWHIYRQAEGTHLAKLDAFLTRYAAGPVLAAFWQAWNREADCAANWPVLREALPALRQHADRWERAQTSITDLAAQLVEFTKSLLK